MKKILEQVTQKEVYNKACEILNRFGEGRPPHQLTATGKLYSLLQIYFPLDNIEFMHAIEFIDLKNNVDLCGYVLSHCQFLAVAAHNQSLIGSKLGTPQKLQPQQIIKAGVTPTNQPRQAIMPVPTPRTPINVRSMPPTASSIFTPSFGQYKIGSPTPIVGECAHSIVETQCLNRTLIILIVFQFPSKLQFNQCKCNVRYALIFSCSPTRYTISNNKPKSKGFIRKGSRLFNK